METVIPNHVSTLAPKVEQQGKLVFWELPSNLYPCGSLMWYLIKSIG